MRLANGDVGFKPALATRRGVVAWVALAIAYVLMVAVSTLAPAPAVAQFGGFGNIHVFIGGGHWRGRHYGRGHRHSRHHQRDKEEPEEAASPALPTSPSSPPGASASNPPAPSAPPGPPAGARPEPRAPNFDPTE